MFVVSFALIIHYRMGCSSSQHIHKYELKHKELMIVAEHLKEIQNNHYSVKESIHILSATKNDNKEEGYYSIISI